MDTAADKALRFACGVVLGALVAVSVLDGFEALPLLVVPGVCGLLAVAYGDNFFERLIRLADKF